jgi:hypothetical protein
MEVEILVVLSEYVQKKKTLKYALYVRIIHVKHLTAILGATPF